MKFDKVFQNILYTFFIILKNFSGFQEYKCNNQCSSEFKNKAFLLHQFYYNEAYNLEILTVRVFPRNYFPLKILTYFIHSFIYLFNIVIFPIPSVNIYIILMQHRNFSLLFARYYFYCGKSYSLCNMSRFASEIKNMAS